MSRRQCWAEAFGPYGFKVRVEEHRSGGPLYARLPNPGYAGPGTRRYVEKALGHTDRERAKAWALGESEKLRAGVDSAADPIPTAARVFAKYLGEMTPGKSRSTRYHDARCTKLWTRVLGPQKDLAKITPGEWRTFTRQRGAGAIDGEGQSVPEPVKPEDAKRRPVRARTVAADLEWLKSVLIWATHERDTQGRYLLRENPVRDGKGYPIPEEPNPRRPVASQDRLEALLTVAAGVHPYLPDVLAIGNGTGRRIRATLALRGEDLRLTRTKTAPHGGIQWPGETDKEGKAWAAPVNAAVRSALERRLAIGAAYLFPYPGDPTRPVSYELASTWLKRAERRAKLPKQKGTLWHAYRRKWATERKHLPIQDVMQAGGWSDPTCLQTMYQQPDEATLYLVVSQPAELREAKA
jgi:hypothetical protein